MKRILQAATGYLQTNRAQFSAAQQLALAQYVDFLTDQELLLHFREIANRIGYVLASEATYFDGPLTAWLAASREGRDVDQQFAGYAIYRRGKLRPEA